MRGFGFVISVFAAAMLAAGCNEISVHDAGPTSASAITIGSGRFVTEARAVQGFSAISVSAGGHVVLTQSGGESLEITAEDNILPLVEASVVNGRLRLGFKAHAGSLTTHGVTFRVGARDLSEISGSGGSQINVTGISTDRLVVALSGGSMLAASGSVDRLELELNGGSRCQAASLRSRVVTATLSGGSTALIRVAESLVAVASSGSTLEFLGDPAVQVQTSGGSVVRRGGP